MVTGAQTSVQISAPGVTFNHTKNRVRSTVARPFNFGAKLGLIGKNPLGMASNTANLDTAIANVTAILASITASPKPGAFFTGAR
jgi:hypothetical protein